MNLKLDFENSKWQIQCGGRQNKNSINFSVTSYTGVFGVTDYESVMKFSKLKMANPIWRMSYKKFHHFLWYAVHGGFWSDSLRIWNYIFKIQNGRSSMADVMSKIPSIFPIPPSTKYQKYFWKFAIWLPPYWIYHFESWKSNFRFKVSDPKTLE